MLFGRASLLLLLAALQLAACQPSQPQGFIRVSDGRFVDDSCREFVFHGWNGWQLVKNAMANPSSVTELFREAQAAKLTVLRFFIADDESGPTFLRGPTDFDETAARALDLIISEAGKAGIRLTIVLLNTWKKPNGVQSFEQWCGTAGMTSHPRPDIDSRGSGGMQPQERLQTPYDWLMSPKCRQQVKDYFAALVSRKNTITGVAYRDDPTILSWNVLNEPRCKYCGPDAVDSWIGEMAAYMKSIDPNHLITTGEEGFFDDSDPMSRYNPGNDAASQYWGSHSGQNFRANHAHAAIDYASIHAWPDNWGKPDLGWGRQWIGAHKQVAAELGKPLILEEFGKQAADGEISRVRDPWYEMVHSEVEASLQAGEPLRGAMFWEWGGPWGEQSASRGPTSNLVRKTDSTFTAHIAPFARQLADSAAAQGPLPGCTPRSSSAASAATAGSAGGPAVQSFSAGASARKMLAG